MTIERYEIELAGIAVEVVRKEIKNLHVGVYPPCGRVRVAAPMRLDDDAVRLALISRLGWIKRQQGKLIQQARQSRREMVSGESHFFQGRRYLLDVDEHEGPPAVRLSGNAKLVLRVRHGTDHQGREQVLHDWYRQQLRTQIPALVAKWEPRVGRTVDDVRIKKMKTRWGSCNADARRVWLNLELAKKPALCLEYILVHEMVHLIERRHNDSFRQLMDTLMPSWRICRDELNRSPLAHEDWVY